MANRQSRGAKGGAPAARGARCPGGGQRRKDRPGEWERVRLENESLRRQIAERDQEIAQQQREIGRKQQEIAEQQRQIQDLERKLAAHQRNSTNSSKPPSSDGLAGAERPRGRARPAQRHGRKPGGQPGHAGHHRPLAPREQVAKVEVVLPPECKHCGKPLPQESPETVGEPRRHQVTEIPKISAWITEYQRPGVRCGSCRHCTYAPLPAAVRGEFGPQLTALVAYWTVVCRLPRRLVEQMLNEVLGIEMSLGSTQKV